MTNKIHIDLTFWNFIYLGLSRLRKGKEITLWDMLQTAKQVRDKIELINRNKNSKKLFFTKDGLEIDINWLQRLEVTPVRRSRMP